VDWTPRRFGCRHQVKDEGQQTFCARHCEGASCYQ
jgi:hypothetical protein